MLRSIKRWVIAAAAILALAGGSFAQGVGPIGSGGGGGATAPGGADTQVQFNDAGAFGGDAGLTFNKTTNDLTVTGILNAGNAAIATGTITTSQPMTLTQTWNDGAVAFKAFLVNPTITAAASTSRIADFQYNGNSQFYVKADASQGAAQAVFVSTDGNGALLSSGSANFTLSANSVARLYLSTGNGGPLAIGYLGIAATGGATTPDVILYADAANTLAQRNGTAAQALRVYNTWTDASNYERGVFDWTTNANALTVGTQVAGTGTVRSLYLRSASAIDVLSGGPLYLQSGGANNIDFYTNTGLRWRIGSAGHFVAPTDNTYDIGASGATRPRDVFVADDVVAGGDGTFTAALTGNTVGTAGFTVAGLPTPQVAGRRAYVTDQLAACVAPGAALTGGGAVVCPVFDDGTAWVGG